jgi:hypothetical protein
VIWAREPEEAAVAEEVHEDPSTFAHGLLGSFCMPKSSIKLFLDLFFAIDHANPECNLPASAIRLLEDVRTQFVKGIPVSRSRPLKTRVRKTSSQVGQIGSQLSLRGELVM